MGLAGVLYDCEPRGFGDEITNEEKDAMNVYYFTGREVNVDNMFEYRKQVEEDMPEVVVLAKNALHKVAAKYRVDKLEVEELFSE